MCGIYFQQILDLAAFSNFIQLLVFLPRDAKKTYIKKLVQIKKCLYKQTTLSNTVPTIIKDLTFCCKICTQHCRAQDGGKPHYTKNKYWFLFNATFANLKESPNDINCARVTR